MKIKLFITIALALLISSCANPTEFPSDTENQPAQTIDETSAPADDTTEAATETATEAVTEEDTTPVVLFENEVYSVSRIGAQYYINFTQGNTLRDGETNPGVGEIEFDSIQSMKQAFLNGGLDGWQSAILRSLFSPYNNTNGIRIWNLDELYQAVYPDGVSETRVSLTPYCIQFYNTAGCLLLLTEESYHDLYNSKYHKYLESGVTILNQATGVYDGTPCEIVEYKHPYWNSVCRDILLSVDQNGKQLHIKISYHLPSSPDENAASEILPYQVEIFGQELGQYFEFSDFSVETSPTVEWLTSFGVTPYVDNADQSAS